MTVPPYIGILTAWSIGVDPLIEPGIGIRVATHSVISADLVNWVNAIGGQAVAIPFDLPRSQLMSMLPYLQGVIVPGEIRMYDTNIEEPLLLQYRRTLRFITDYVQWKAQENAYQDEISYGIKKDAQRIFLYAFGHGFDVLSDVISGKKVSSCGLIRPPRRGKSKVDWQAVENGLFFKQLNKADMDFSLVQSDTVFMNECIVEAKHFDSSGLLGKIFRKVASYPSEDRGEVATVIEHYSAPIIATQHVPFGSLSNPQVPQYARARSIVDFHMSIGLTLTDWVASTPRKPIADSPLALQTKYIISDSPVIDVNGRGQVYTFKRWNSLKLPDGE